MTVKDVFDNDLSIGDIVCYAVTQGQTARMRFGFITNITGGRDNRVTVNGYSKNFRYDPLGEREYQRKKWIGKKGSSAHSQMKMMQIHPDILPDDLKDIMLEDARTLLTE